MGSATSSTDGAGDSNSNGSNGGPTPNIIVYAARYNSGLPYEGPVTVQLREYLPGSRCAYSWMCVQCKRLHVAMEQVMHMFVCVYDTPTGNVFVCGKVVW